MISRQTCILAVLRSGLTTIEIKWLLLLLLVMYSEHFLVILADTAAT